MRHDVKYCPFNGKVSFPSEAAALRRAEKYDDIQRVYLCKCGDWHLTHHKEGGYERPKQSVSANQIKGRIEKLYKRINDEG